jgi:hypothetical protein
MGTQVMASKQLSIRILQALSLWCVDHSFLPAEGQVAKALLDCAFVRS